MAEEPKQEEKQEQKAQKGMVSTQKNDKFYQEEENITIMPTMIDNSDMKDERKRNLSSIIPKDDSMPTIKENEMSLTSKEKELKSDGAVVLGSIDSNAEVTINAAAVLPEPIDIEQRKAEMKKNSTKKRGVKKRVSHKKEHQVQNLGSLIAIIAIAIIGGTIYYYFNRPKDSDFQPKNVTVELGQSLPIRASSYVTPGVGTEVDEMLYVIDKKDVLVDTVGTYNFYVTYNGIKKTGKIKIEDTTPPQIEYKDSVTIVEGESYSPGTFIESCIDQSGCTYAFQDSATTKKYNTAGVYNIYIVASDAYDNKITKRVQLVIESEENVKIYDRKTPFDFSKGYEMTETYDLHFREQSDGSKILYDSNYTFVRKYHDTSTYHAAREEFVGHASYKLDDTNMTITHTEVVTTIGNNYSRPDEIKQYLTREGYTERE